MDYPQWKAPGEDGEVLIWPPPGELLELTGRNNRMLRGLPLKIQGVAMTELRQRQRQWLGHEQDDLPIIATGHQTELYHPGVWVKNVLIDAAAVRLQGRAVHVSVDTDEPKHLTLRWPGGNEPLADDPKLSSAAWSGLLDGPTPAHLNHLEENLRRAAESWPFGPEMMIWAFIGSMRRQSPEMADLSHGLTNAMHQMDWDLGLKHHALVASPVWQSLPFLVLVYHVMARAQRFASDYNRSLKGFREKYRIDNPGRPMPDLKIQADRCESPFWLDDLSTGTRSRAFLFLRKDRWVLRHQADVAGGTGEAGGRDEFVLEPDREGWSAAESLLKWLRASRLRLSPRALMLTTFLRLLVADQFVHGIGGGRYDQVADDLMNRHFGIEPPGFAVTTATLWFPLAQGRVRACLPCLKQEGHHLRHGLLGEQKMELVRQIEMMPRKSADRSALFIRMRRQLDQAAAESQTLAKWEEKYRAAQAAEIEDQSIFDRELFYALQPRSRLEMMIEKYRRQFAV